MNRKTNNPNGRPKGVPNKINGELREKISALISTNWETVQADIEALEPRDRLVFLERLISYVLPKLQTIQLQDDTQAETVNPVVIFKLPDNGRSFDVKSMSTEELREIVRQGESLRDHKGGEG